MFCGRRKKGRYGVRVQRVQKVHRVQRVVVAADAADYKKGARLAPRVV